MTDFNTVVYDDFNDNVLDRSKWRVVPGDSVFERNGRLEFQWVGTGPGGYICSAETTKIFDLSQKGEAVELQVTWVMATVPHVTVLVSEGNGYLFGVRSDGVAEVYRVVNAQPTLIGSTPVGKTTGVFRVSVTDSEVRFFVDNTLVTKENWYFASRKVTFGFMHWVSNDNPGPFAIDDVIYVTPYWVYPTTMFEQVFSLMVPIMFMFMMVMLIRQMTELAK